MERRGEHPWGKGPLVALLVALLAVVPPWVELLWTAQRWRG